MYPVHIISEERRETIVNEINKWNPVERAAFVIENVKLLPFNLVKLVAGYCSELAENVSALGSGDRSLVTPSSESLEYFSILEAQANDQSENRIY